MKQEQGATNTREGHFYDVECLKVYDDESQSSSDVVEMSQKYLQWISIC